jgi:uncharacterized membrane protein (UPF0127 family)
MTLRWVFNDPKLISNLTRGTVLCERAWEADRPLSRMRGLLGRRTLAPGEGLLLHHAPSIHTAAIRVPIDVVFVDREFRVVKVVERLRPWRIARASQARTALEIAAGEAELRGVSVGDQLAALDRAVDSPEVLQRPDRSDRDRLPVSSRPGRGMRNGSPEPLKDASDSLRVLLVSEDLRFRAVAGELLRHRGFTVTTDARMTAVPRLAARVRADVVVLDAEASPDSVAAETVATVKLCCTVGLVVVCQDARPRFCGIRALAKWGSIDALCQAIEDARPARARVF